MQLCKRKNINNGNEKSTRDQPLWNAPRWHVIKNLILLLKHGWVLNSRSKFSTHHFESWSKLVITYHKVSTLVNLCSGLILEGYESVWPVSCLWSLSIKRGFLTFLGGMESSTTLINLGEMTFFHFGAWSISYNSLHGIPPNEIQCGCYFIAVILTEMKFSIGW